MSKSTCRRSLLVLVLLPGLLFADAPAPDPICEPVPVPVPVTELRCPLPGCCPVSPREDAGGGIPEVAKQAIESATATVDFLKYLIAGILFAGTVAVAILTFFLGREWREWQRALRRQQVVRRRAARELAAIRQRCAEMSEQSSQMAAGLKRQVEAMQDIMQVSSDIPFVMYTIRRLTRPIPGEEPLDREREARDALQKLEEIRTAGENIHHRRLLSWTFAAKSVALQSLGNLSEALEAAERARQLDVKDWADRPYNMACLCALLVASGQVEPYKARALSLLSEAFEKDRALIEFSRTDRELDAIRPEVERLIQNWSVR